METSVLNIKIAEYLGWKKCNCDQEPEHYKYGEMVFESINVKDMDFHKNWISLMPVIEKIIREKFDDGENVYLRTFGMIDSDGQIMARFNRHSLHKAPTLIIATYLAIVEYIGVPINTSS